MNERINMSVWKRKAIECLPELRKEFEKPEISIYDVFSEMLVAVIVAHKEKDDDKLKRIYDFAEWCLNHRGKDIWNAAGVSFYEHLGDNETTLRDFAKWVKPEIYSQIRGLLELRVSETQLKRLDGLYSYHFGQTK